MEDEASKGHYCHQKNRGGGSDFLADAKQQHHRHKGDYIGSRTDQCTDRAADQAYDD